MGTVLDFFACAGMVLAGWWLFHLARRCVLRILIVALDLLIVLMDCTRGTPIPKRRAGAPIGCPGPELTALN
jgi:hypothetical protein